GEHAVHGLRIAGEAVLRAEAGAERVQRARADVAEHDAERGQAEHAQTSPRRRVRRSRPDPVHAAARGHGAGRSAVAARRGRPASGAPVALGTPPAPPSLGPGVLGLDAGHGAALVRHRVPHEAIGLPTLVILGQVLGDRQALLVHEQEAVAVLVLLHLVTRADPAAQLGFFLRIRVEVAGAQGLADLLDVDGEALDHGLRDG